MNTSNFDSSSEMTHKEAVRRITNWLKGQGCGIVVAELRTAINEIPDAIGFVGNGGSILVECKVSRADFLADKVKIFRRLPEIGMGDHRYFATPAGIVLADDDIGAWGLLEIRNHEIKVMREPTGHDSSKRSEVKFLMSIIRRLRISTAVFVGDALTWEGRTELQNEQSTA